MLIEAVTGECVAVPSEHMHGVLDGDAFQHLMRGIGDQTIDRAEQPLAGIDDVRERVLNRAAAGRAVRVVDVAIRGAVRREVLSGDGDQLDRATEASVLNRRPHRVPELVARVRQQAPNVCVELLPLTRDYDYRRCLARGEVDLVIGNWLEPPGEMHLARLFSDEIVCLVGEDHQAVRSPRAWTEARYLGAEHVAPTPMHEGARGVIDDHLASLGLVRQVVVRSPHFGLIPLMLAQTQLVLTTGRQFCSRYIDPLPVRIVKCPIAFPPLTYYQLWHEVTHASARGKWLREQVREVARTLSSHALPARRGGKVA